MRTPSGKNHPLRRGEGEARKRGVFDVRKSQKRSFFGKLWERILGAKVIDLRPKLRESRPALVFGLAALLVSALVLGTRQILTRAEIADFFPSACLGDWDSPNLAQGEPESFGEEGIVPDGTNSGVYDAAKATPLRIFCGKFVPDGFEPKGEIKNVGLTLVWRMEGLPALLTPAEPQILPEPSLDESGNFEQEVAPSELPSSDSVSPQMEIPSPASEPEAEPTPPLPQEPASQESETPAPTSLLLLKNIFGFFGFPSAAAQEENAPAQEPPPSGDPPPAEEPAPTADSPPVGEPTPPDPAAGGVIPSEESAEAVTEEVVAPPIEARLEPVATDETRNTEHEAQVSEEGAMEQVATSAEPEILVPPPDENFLKVNFSTNGNDWFELGRINPQNWQNFTIPISVKTWDELKNLQIMLEGIETSLLEIPKVYLDGMFVEVHYEIVAPEINLNAGDGESDGSTSPAAGESGSARGDLKILDEGAAHKCSLEPFSRDVRRGGSAVYAVSLSPSFENSYFELVAGDMPGGVAVVFDPERGVGTSTPRLTLNVSDGAERGSFGLVVVYREIDAKLEAKANFCQLNLVIE